MKTIIVTLLLLCFIFSGCKSGAQSSQMNASPSSTTGHLASSSDIVTTMPSADITTVPTTQSTNASSTTRRNTIACAPPYRFYSIEDLETYIRTGSTDVSDYSRAPYSGFNHFSETMYVKRIKNQIPYISIQKLLGIDAANFESIQAGVHYWSDGGGYYYYFVDDLAYIVTEYVGDMSLNEWCAKYRISTGDVKRLAGVDIVYGCEEDVHFVVDGFYIRIQIGGHGDAEKEKAIRQEFLTSEKTASLSAFFSKDETKISGTLSVMKTAISTPGVIMNADKSAAVK